MKKFLLNIWYTVLYQFDQHRNEIPLWWYEQKSFDELPNWVKRIVIAQDVIAQINMRRYAPKKGRYVSIDDLHRQNLREGSIQKNFEKIKECQVCGIGACFLSIVRFKNNVNFDEIEQGFWQFCRNKKFRELLTSIFPIKQLLLIEYAFELGQDAMYAKDGEELDWHTEKIPAKEFGMKYHADPFVRLKAIMQNIIDNKGTFKP